MNEPNFNFPALRDAQGKLDAARDRLAKVFREAGPEMDMDKVSSISGTRDEKVDRIRNDNEEITELKKQVESLRDVARAAANAGEGAREKADGAGDVELKAPAFGDAFARTLPEMKRARHQEIKMGNIEVKDLFGTGRFAGAPLGWSPESVRSGRVELTPLRPEVHVVDFIPSGTIAQASYKYMEETTHTSNAVEIEEAAAFGEAVLALTERSKPVEKIGAWIPVTDEQLEDEPAAAAYVQSRLTQQIQRRLDSQVLLGNGTSPNLLGTESVSGIQTQAKGTDSTMDAAHKLFTKIRDDGFAEPNVAFIAPSKWQDVVLTKTADGQYIWGHPSVVGPQTLWGVPVVQTTAHTSTKLIAGDFATYSMLFLRRGMDVQLTNAHSDFFIKGKQAIRADIRVVMIHFRPKAFGTVTGL